MQSLDEPEFDLSIIRGIAGDDRDLEREFILTFIEETRSQLAILETQVTGGLNPGWVDTAHHIKGSASNMGAKKLYDACYRAQNCNAPTTTTDERMLLLSQIRSSATSLISYLEKNELA